MCRYAMVAYKPHYACFECRKAFKRRLLRDINRDACCAEKINPSKCPECGSLMANMGLDFESPPKKAIKAWRHIQDLYTVGVTFHSCGCNGPGYIPKDKKALLCFLEEKKETYIEHRRFWSTRITSKTQDEKDKDWAANSQFLYSIPDTLKTGTKKNKYIDIVGAIAYWAERIQRIEQEIKTLQEV